MNRDINDIDDFFRNALDTHTGVRSELVWNKLVTRLDKEDKVAFKEIFTKTKRVLFLLFLLPGIFFTYEMIRRNTILQVTAESNRLPGKQKKTSSEYITAVSRNTCSENKTQIVMDFLKIKGVHIEKPYPKKTTIKNKEIPAFTTNLGLNKKKGKSDINNISPEHNNEQGNSQILQRDLNSARGLNKNEFPLTIQTNMYHSISFLIKPPTGLMTTSTLKPSVVVVKANKMFKPFWSISVAGAPEWTMYRLANNPAQLSVNHPNPRSEIEERENNELSFAGGIALSYQFANHWALQSGLVFSNTSISIDPQTIYAIRESSGEIAYKYSASTGYAYVKPGFSNSPAVGDSLITNGAQHTIQYFSIPVMIKYEIDKGRFSVIPSIGLSVNFITSAKIQTELTDLQNTQRLTIKKLNGTRVFYAGLLGSAEIRYRCNPRFSVSIIPVFRSAITSITKSNVVKTYPYSFGAGFGISYSF